MRICNICETNPSRSLKDRKCKSCHNKQSREHYHNNLEAQRKRGVEKGRRLGHIWKERRHPLLSIYKGMVRRCRDVNSPKYKNWGGRGIRVCDRWLGDNGFNNFVEDMYPSYSPGLTIDRYPDNNGNYAPNNCRWATLEEQAQNKRNNLDYRESIPEDSPIYLEYGKLGTLKEFCEIHNFPLKVAKHRYAINWDPEYILDNTLPGRRYEYKGRTYSLTELSILSGILPKSLSTRIFNNNWSVEDAVEIPILLNKQNIDADDPMLDTVKVNNNGVEVSLKELSENTGIPLIVIKNRYTYSSDLVWLTGSNQGIRTYLYRNNKYTLHELSLFTGLVKQTIYSRINQSGWSLEKALEEKLR